MNKSECLLSVIVCTYNRAELLRTCLDSLVEQTLNDCDFEVIVVNNNSTDHTSQVVESFLGKIKHLKVVVETRQGLSHARNLGWQTVEGIYVAYLDDDAIADSEWCGKIFNSFSTVQPQPAAVGGKILPWYECTPPCWFDDMFEVRTWGEAPGFLDGSNAPFGFSGSNMAFQRQILERFGGFSDQFGMKGGVLRLGEETDLFLRVYATYQLFWYDPSIIVRHFTPKVNMTVRYRLERNFISGMSNYSYRKCKFLSSSYFLTLASFLFHVIKLPYALIRTKRKLSTELIFCLQGVSRKAGFLLAPFRIN